MGDIHEFIESLKFEGRYSQHTITAYFNDLTSFSEFVSAQFAEFNLNDSQSFIVRAWLVSLSENGLKPATINRKLTSLRTYFNFLKKNGIIKVNPLTSIAPVKKDKNLPSYVSEESMEKLFGLLSFPDNYEGALDKSLILMLYSTGMRLSELINLKESDIDFYNSQIRVLGKRNKERIIPLISEISNLLKEYIHLKRKEFGTNNHDVVLFITPTGINIYQKYVYRKINYYLGLITTLSKKSPHILRHSFATHMLNHGADLNAIKEILGHASLAATQVYTHNSIEKLKTVYKQAHPKA